MANVKDTLWAVAPWAALGVVATGVGVGWWARSRSSAPALTPGTESDPDPETEPDFSYPPPEELLTERILDRREEGIDAMTRRMEQTKQRISRGPGSRDAGEVDSLVLHQTGFTRGDDPTKYYKVTAHFLILPNGQIVWLHPFDEYLNASHALNRKSVAVEFIGNFPGPNGKCWKPEKFGCHTLSEAQVEAGRDLVQWLKQVVPKFRAVYAHRQSAALKANDPGPDIWRAVGEYAIHELGLEDTRDETFGTGKPIPSSWRTDGERAADASAFEGPTPTHHDEDDASAVTPVLRARQMSRRWA